MFSKDEFRKYAIKHQGISSSTVDSFTSMMNNYISTIIEERQMNVASMDVFSRLMMDRIIFRRAYKRLCCKYHSSSVVVFGVC